MMIFENEENSTLLFETGYEKPLHQLGLDDVSGVKAALTDYVIKEACDNIAIELQCSIVCL